MSNENHDDSVGYKKPPKSHQFRPGQSGNPNGRPKGARNFKSDLRDELSEMTSFRDCGHEISISKQRAGSRDRSCLRPASDQRSQQDCSRHQFFHGVNNHGYCYQETGADQIPGLRDEGFRGAEQGPQARQGQVPQACRADPHRRRGRQDKTARRQHAAAPLQDLHGLDLFIGVDFGTQSLSQDPHPVLWSGPRRQDRLRHPLHPPERLVSASVRYQTC